MQVLYTGTLFIHILYYNRKFFYKSVLKQENFIEPLRVSNKHDLLTMPNYISRYIFVFYTFYNFLVGVINNSIITKLFYAPASFLFKITCHSCEICNFYQLMIVFIVPDCILYTTLNFRHISSRYTRLNLDDTKVYKKYSID